MSELAAVAKALVAPGRGVLATEESNAVGTTSFKSERRAGKPPTGSERLATVVLVMAAVVIIAIVRGPIALVPLPPILWALCSLVGAGRDISRPATRSAKAPTAKVSEILNGTEEAPK